MSTRKLKSLYDYHSAEVYLAATKPVRTSGLVPLCENRKDHRRFNIRRLPDNAIACRLYNTDVVTYYPDGSTRVDTSWGSAMTNGFANCYTTAACYTRRRKPIVSTGGQSFLCPKGGVLISADGTIRPEYNPALAAQRVKVLRRGAVAEAARAMKPFLQYAASMAALGDLPVESVHSMGFIHADRRAEAVGDPERWPALVASYYLIHYGAVNETARSRLDTDWLKRDLRAHLYVGLGLWESVPLEWGKLPSNLSRLTVAD